MYNGLWLFISMSAIGTIILFTLLVLPWNRIKERQEQKQQEQELARQAEVEKQRQAEWLAYTQTDEYKQQEELRLKKLRAQQEYDRKIVAKARAAKAAKQRKENKWLAGFAEMSVKEFFELRKKNPENFTGVYILNNTTKHKYYVGQAIRIFSRVNNHFTGKGNGDVYADYKYKDNFTIRLIPLSKSGYTSLDKLEKDMIAKFKANTTGYNKTAGNN